MQPSCDLEGLLGYPKNLSEGSSWSSELNERLCTDLIISSLGHPWGFMGDRTPADAMTCTFFYHLRIIFGQ